jgi:ribosomal protein S12 methylthiotransferase
MPMSEGPAGRRIALPVVSPSPSRPHSPSLDASIRIITLGCDKNTVDSERISAGLAAAGARLDDADADIIVINTCGFIDAAREESVDTILDAVRLKQEGRARAVVAMGCMVQRYRDELIREIPEVDLFLGLTETNRLVPELRRRGLLAEGLRDAPNMERPLRLLGRSTHTSFLKISEGCDHACAFCAIPLMRGKHRSTPMDVLLQEAKQLEAAGIAELSIVSQDTTWYGRDLQRGVEAGPAEWFVGRPFAGMAGVDRAPDIRLPDESRDRREVASGRGGLLASLLRRLLDETAIPWLRLFYMYPSGIRRDLVELMAGEPRLVNYLDMPIQHGSDDVLKRMKRPERQATIRERVRWLRDAIPDIALRTTVIVGFPGETEDDFEAMLELLEELRFDHVGAFPYSVEEDTPAATMPDAVGESAKRDRLERVFDLQREISRERNERWIGRDVRVLIDGSGEPEHAPGTASGRTEHQALEIDGTVHVDRAGDAKAGDFVMVRITDALDDELIGERIAGHD